MLGVIADLTKKYRPVERVDLPNRTWPDKTLDSAPIWCSVDLRDGNQALIEPMNVEQKLEMFALLCNLGFKEIEVAFPAASEIEFSFVRTLIEEGLIPDDVTIQVLTQAREALIRRSFEAVRGSRQAIVHLYNSTSPAQRRAVFGMTEDQVVDLAVEGTKLIKKLAGEFDGTHVRMEYSPESFTSTELPYALRICEAVVDVWEPTPDKPIILNLPATVEIGTPNFYADQIEWMCRHLRDRSSVLVSVHTHNDRGGAVAAAELGQMAGADRVEGTLFGYGERTGNVDIVTLALNLMAQGVDPKLDLSQLPTVTEVVRRLTDEPIHPRHPYVGELVYTAFSGSHQDAINKGMQERTKREDDTWDVPYLLIDPLDIGRKYEGIIRVNSQSGKGGVAYLLRIDHGLDLPKAMHPDFAKVVQLLAEKTGKEVQPDEIFRAFSETYLNPVEPYELVAYGLATERGATVINASFAVDGALRDVEGRGNGPIEALAHALRALGAPNVRVTSFHEHNVERGTTARAAAYVQIDAEGQSVWGAALDPSTAGASLRALVSAVNRVSHK
ncbi:2-isopropylmalate synthase [bacterium]|nr:MAG: 2-isopropylmalate synthase [bacterium]